MKGTINQSIIDLSRLLWDIQFDKNETKNRIGIEKITDIKSALKFIKFISIEENFDNQIISTKIKRGN